MGPLAWWFVMAINTGGSSHAIARVLRSGARASAENAKIKSHLSKAYRRKLSGARTGRVYTTYFFTDGAGNVRPIGHRPPHQASAPGEAPARDTGELIRSMRYNSKRLRDGAEIIVRNEAPYATYLEYGTSKMLARPFFRITLKEESEAMRRIWRDGIERRERQAARSLGGGA